MLNYINDLYSKYNELVNQKSNEENKFKLVDLNVEISNLESKINYCVNLVIKKYSNENVFDYAKGILSNENLNEAKEKANKFNNDVLGATIRRDESQIAGFNAIINNVLSKNPNAENEEYKDTDEYKTIKSNRENIINLEKHILETKAKGKDFIEYLSFEDKMLLVSNLLKVNNADLDSQKDLLKQAQSYYAPLEYLHNATYPLDERINQLTKDKDSSLAKYLLENKETIDRLTVKTNSDTSGTIFTKKVKKIEDQYGNLRHREFARHAKKAKIEDIVTEQGQFKGKKIYYNEEHHQRFLQLHKELLTTQETKEKFKFLLKQMDALNIHNNVFNVGESNYKEYGFAKLLELKEKFINEINKEPANEEQIKASLEELKQQEEAINKMYELIKQTIGDDYETTPQNVDSYRNLFVPPCFKNNLSLNSKFNSLYIMLSFIKEKNLDIDEFVENPISLSSKAMEESFQNNNLDNLLDGKSKGEALVYLSDFKNLPIVEDPYKFTRCFELIVKCETNDDYATVNNIASMAFNSTSGNLNRASCISKEFFDRKPIETLEYFLMAKKGQDGKIPYLSCYVPPYDIHEDIKTNMAIDARETVIEQISKDDNIKERFYEALEALRHYTNYRKNQGNVNSVNVHSRDVFKAVQLLASKIIVTLDLQGNSKDQRRGFDKQFVDDVYNIIESPKKVAQLNGLRFHKDQKRFDAIKKVIENKDKLVKNYEKNMISFQKSKEETFIREFERINKEIDELDKQADKISSKLEKGATNKQIEDIAALQREKFIELQNLQNNRIDQLKEDLRKGRISKYYFEKRTEQVLLLENIKDIPSMYMSDDKNYKDFKTYAKQVLKINVKTLNQEELHNYQENYDRLMADSKEEKRLYILNNVLKNEGLSSNKAFNYDKIEKIEINNNIEEMKQLSDDLILENQKIKEAFENEKIKRIEVDLKDDVNIISNEVVEEEKSIDVVKDIV